MKPYERRNYHLEPDELAKVELAFKTDKRRGVKVRCQAIKALHMGLSVDETAELCGSSFKTIYRWHTLYLEGGIDGLVASKPGGKAPKATAAYRQELTEVLDSAPARYGYDFTIWTAERLCTHLEAVTGIALRPRTMYDLLNQMGYAFRRPKLSLKHLQDPEAVAAAQQNWERLKRGRVARTTPTVLTNWSPWTKPD